MKNKNEKLISSIINIIFFITVFVPMSVFADPSPSPRPYSLSELRTQAMERSFNSQIEFEHMYQAKKAAQASKLNLLPHFSINSIIALYSRDAASLLGSIGDLVPFLLPNRWFQAKENSERSAAENDTAVIVQADSGSLIEIMAYSILRDQELSASLNSSIIKTTAIRDELSFRERLGQIQPGAHDDVTSIIVQLQKNLAVLNEGINEQYYALAESAGMIDPSSIQSLLPLSNDEKPTITLLESGGLFESILEHSYELKQLDHLLHAQEFSRKERWISWLDPSADPSSSLGAGIIPSISIGKSQVREIEIRRKQMEGILAQRLKSFTDAGNLQANLYQLSNETTKLQNRRVERLLSHIRIGSAFALSDLVNAVQDQIKNELDLIGAQYAYWMIKSNLNRLQMSGPYSQLIQN